MYVSKWNVELVENTVSGHKEIDNVLCLRFTYNVEERRLIYFITPYIKWKGCKYESSRAIFDFPHKTPHSLEEALKMMDHVLLGMSIIRRSINNFEIRFEDGSVVMTFHNNVVKLYVYPKEGRKSMIGFDLKKVGIPSNGNYPVIMKTRMDNIYTDKIEYLYRV